MGLHFLSLSFAVDITLKSFLAALHIPCQIQATWALPFLILPLHHQTLSLSLLGYLSLLPGLVGIDQIKSWRRSQNHRIPEFKGTHKDHQNSTPGPAQDSPPPRLTWCAWEHCPNTSVKLGVVTTSQGSPFQCPGIPWVKNLFLTSNLILPSTASLIPLCPIPGQQREDINVCSFVSPGEEAADYYEVFPWSCPGWITWWSHQVLLWLPL